MVEFTLPISTTIVIGCVMKRPIILWVWRKVNGSWENNTIKIFQSGNTVEKILGLEEINSNKKTYKCHSQISKWESQSMSKIVWDKRVHQVYQFHQNKLTSLKRTFFPQIPPAVNEVLAPIVSFALWYIYLTLILLLTGKVNKMSMLLQRFYFKGNG